MKKENKINISVILIGSSADSVINSIVQKLQEFEIEYVACAEIYSAVSHLAKSTAKKIIIIGRFENLRKEREWFLKLSQNKDVICCCIKNSIINQKIKHKKVFAIEHPHDIEDVLKQAISCENDGLNPCAGKFLKEEFYTTQEEINALLNVNEE